MTPGTAKYVSKFRSDAKRINDVIQGEFRKANTKRRVLIIYVLHEVCQQTKHKGMEFIRVFGNSLKQYMKIFVRNNDSVGSIQEAMKLVRMWNDQQLFSKNFIETLNTILKSRVRIFC